MLKKNSCYDFMSETSEYCVKEGSAGVVLLCSVNLYHEPMQRVNQANHYEAVAALKVQSLLRKM